MIQLSRICKSYKTGSITREVLKELDLHLEAGERIAIMGPSGSGKTTLLNLCGAMDRPDDGEVLYKGNPLPWDKEKDLASFRNSHVGFIFQEHYLLGTLTVLENILVPAMVKGRSTEDDRKRALDLLRELGLEDRTDSFPGELSGGENQRVAVARAMINSPGLLLCDEPTGSLDEDNSDVLMNLLLKTAGRNDTAVILVTHSKEIASRLDRLYRLDHGKLIEGKAP